MPQPKHTRKHANCLSPRLGLHAIDCPDNPRFTEVSAEDKDRAESAEFIGVIARSAALFALDEYPRFMDWLDNIPPVTHSGAVEGFAIFRALSIVAGARTEVMIDGNT